MRSSNRYLRLRYQAIIREIIGIRKLVDGWRKRAYGCVTCNHIKANAVECKRHGSIFTMDQITSTINTFVAPLLTSEQGRRLVQQHRTSITAAVALISSSYAIFRYITKVPRQLKHFPHLGYFDYLKAVVTGKSMDDIALELTIPIAMRSKSGMYVVSIPLQCVMTW